MYLYLQSPMVCLSELKTGWVNNLGHVLSKQSFSQSYYRFVNEEDAFLILYMEDLFDLSIRGIVLSRNIYLKPVLYRKLMRDQSMYLPLKKIIFLSNSRTWR